MTAQIGGSNKNRRRIWCLDSRSNGPYLLPDVTQCVVMIYLQDLENFLLFHSLITGLTSFLLSVCLALSPGAALFILLSPRLRFTSLPVVSLTPLTHAKANGLGSSGNLCDTPGMEAMDVKYKPAMFPNGFAKKVKPAAVAPAVGETMYRECLKNHAASLGGHALDGCGEFMPSPAANPADPSSFKCAACGCHRNFHRRLMEGSPPPLPPAMLPAPPMPASVLHGQPHRGEEAPEDRLPGVDGDDSDSDSDGSEYDDERSVSPSLPPPAHLPAPVAQQPPPAYFSSGPHMLLSLSSSAPGAAGAAQRLPAQVSPATAPPHGAMPARKRFRTKFTTEQKQRMQELSERLGWRLQKRDEAIVDEWCRDIGVSKGVFKVWMHNNKHNYLGGHSARRSASSAAASSVTTTPTAPAAPGPFHLSTAGAAAPPPFNPSTTHSSPAPTATGFNINGTATSATTAAHTVTAGHPENGASSPQSA